MYTQTKLSPSPKRSVRSGLMASCIAALGFAYPAHAGDMIVNFDPAGSQSTWVGGINDSGAVTGYYQEMIPGVGAQRGFVRDADGTIETFAPDGARATFAESIDAAGTVAGYYTDVQTGVERGFVRSASLTPASTPGITVFDALYTPGGVSTYAWSISGGEIAGSYTSDAVTYHGYVRKADGTFERFDPQGSKSTYALGINNGSVTGYYFDGSTDHCFLRAANQAIVAFDPPGALDSKCVAINAKGWVAGYYRHTDGNGTLGFVRSPRGKFALFNVEGITGSTYVWGINDKAAVAGSWYDGSGEAHGIARAAAGNIKTFDPAGSTNTYAMSVNSKDSIAGYWEDSYGQNHGFVRIRSKTPNMGQDADPIWPPSPARSAGVVPPSGVIMKVNPLVQQADRAGGGGPVAGHHGVVKDPVIPTPYTNGAPSGVIMKVNPLVQQADRAGGIGPVASHHGVVKDPVIPTSYTNGGPSGVIMKVNPLVQQADRAGGVGPVASHHGVVRDPVIPTPYTNGAPSGVIMKVNPLVQQAGRAGPFMTNRGPVRDPMPLSHTDGKGKTPVANVHRITDPILPRTAAN